MARRLHPVFSAVLRTAGPAGGRAARTHPGLLRERAPTLRPGRAEWEVTPGPARTGEPGPGAGFPGFRMLRGIRWFWGSRNAAPRIAYGVPGPDRAKILRFAGGKPKPKV